MTLAEAGAEAAALAEAGSERELSDLRRQWEEEVEMAARSSDYRERAVAYRAIGQFRFRQKLELLSREHPGAINGLRPMLHELLTHDGNEAVRRLAVVALRNGSPRPDTIQILAALGEDDEQSRELREAAAKVAQALRRKGAR